MAVKTAPPGPAPRVSPPLFTRPFVALCLGNLLFLGSLFLLLPVLPLYVTSLGGNERDVGLVVGAFTLSALILRLLVGRWVDQGWSRRRLLTIGMGVFFVSGLLYPVARSLPLLLGLRLFHGTGIAAYGTTAQAMVAQLVPAPRLGEAMGYFGMAMSLSMAIAPAAGVALLEWTNNYPVVFLMSALLVALTWVVTLGVPEPPRRAAPIVPWRQLFNRRAWLPFVLALFSSLSFSVVGTFLPLLVQERNLGNAGLYFTIYSLVVFLVRVIAGRISDRFGRGVVIVPGLILLAVALVMLAFAQEPVLYIASGILFGLGFGAASPALMALAIEVVPPAERGSAVATYTAGFEIGIGGGSILFGIVLEQLGFLVTFMLAGLGPLLGAGIYLIGFRAGRAYSAEGRRVS